MRDRLSMQLRQLVRSAMEERVFTDNVYAFVVDSERAASLAWETLLRDYAHAALLVRHNARTMTLPNAAQVRIVNASRPEHVQGQRFSDAVFDDSARLSVDAADLVRTRVTPEEQTDGNA